MSKVFNKYYTLKRKYDGKVEKYINDLIKEKEDLSSKERRLLFKKKKFLCLNCERPVNMIFTETDTELKVICGDTSEPCNLNITIEKGKYIQKDDYLQELYEELQELKEKIIINKLDLMFEYDNEEKVLENFESTKQDINKITKQIEQINRDFNESMQTVEKKISYNEKKVEFYISLEEFKELLQSYVKERVNNYAFLRDALELYMNKIVILQEQMRDLKYNYYGIDSEQIGSKKKGYKKFYFYKERYSLEDTQVVIKEEKKLISKK